MAWSKRINARCAGVFIAFGCTVLLLYQLTIKAQNISCPLPPQVLEINLAGWKCEKERVFLRTADSKLCLGTQNIFFIETAGSKSLNPRQACAIESAARYHPTYDILVLMTPTEAIDYDNGVMRVLRNLVNVQIIRTDIANMVYGTFLHEWYTSNVWKKSKYQITHMSDILRFFLLWMYGGMYLDMDVVVLRPLESLKNTVVSDNGVNAGSSVMFFDRGHDILRIFMSDFVNRYDPEGFAANGPVLINRNIQKYCHIKSIADIREAKCGLDILPQYRAYPIPYERWEDYFVPSNISSLAESFNSSYLIHTWNWLSSKRDIVIGSNCLYEVAMKQHCPLVYDYSQQFKHV